MAKNKLKDKLPVHIISRAMAAYLMANGTSIDVVKSAMEGNLNGMVRLLIANPHSSIILRRRRDNKIDTQFRKYRVVQQERGHAGPANICDDVDGIRSTYYMVEDDGIGVGSWLTDEKLWKLRDEYNDGDYHVTLCINDTHYHVEDN